MKRKAYQHPLVRITCINIERPLLAASSGMPTESGDNLTWDSGSGGSFGADEEVASRSSLWDD